MPHQGSRGRVGRRDGLDSLRETRPILMLAQRPVQPSDPAGHAVVSALQGAVARIAASDLEARRGDAGGIHRLRTSTRRLRSELRAFRDLVDPHWREQLDGELKWLAGLLGGVRDLDVQLARLRKAGSTLAVRDERSLRPLFRSLRARHGVAAKDLRSALRSERYLSLRDALDRAIRRPMLMDEARERCDLALPVLAVAAWRRLKKAGRALAPSAPDEDFHNVRKIAKRARYTAELIAPVLSQPLDSTAARFIRLTTQVQDVLGAHQDAVVAIEAIQCRIADHADDPDFIQAANRLIETQKAAARTALTAFFKTWDKLDRKKWRRWMKCRSKAVARSMA